jgi:hypothetical protein
MDSFPSVAGTTSAFAVAVFFNFMVKADQQQPQPLVLA